MSWRLDWVEVGMEVGLVWIGHGGWVGLHWFESAIGVLASLETELVTWGPRCGSVALGGCEDIKEGCLGLGWIGLGLG